MLTDPSKTIIDKEQEITIYDDSYELAEKLRDIIEEADLYPGHAYYLKEAAIHIETLFDNYKSLLFIAHHNQSKDKPTDNSGRNNLSEPDSRQTIYIKDFELDTRIQNCLLSVFKKRYSDITLLDIENARWPNGNAVRWRSVQNFGKGSHAKLKSIMNEHGYILPRYGRL